MKKNRGWLKIQLQWLYYKIIRENATPEYVARGWAIGMFYGCFIPFGLQLACSIPTSFILKGSKIERKRLKTIRNSTKKFLIPFYLLC